MPLYWRCQDLQNKLLEEKDQGARSQIIIKSIQVRIKLVVKCKLVVNLSGFPFKRVVFLACLIHIGSVLILFLVKNGENVAVFLAQIIVPK